MRILLGIDTTLSSATLQAIRVVCDLMRPAEPSSRLVLLHVLPTTHVSSIHPGLATIQSEMLFPSQALVLQAEKMLQHLRFSLEVEGWPLEQTEALVRIGVPAEEIVKTVRDCQISLVVLGHHPPSLQRWLAHFVHGSISRQVLKSADCPVLLVSLPRKLKRPSDKQLVAWYEKALIGYLRAQSTTLMVLTPQQVAQQFLPPSLSSVEPYIKEAAEQALANLARRGVLCQHEIKGQSCYIND